MQLIIAEKPSVAADLARALPGTFRQQEGYWEGSETLISWAIGHLLELSEPEYYDPELKNWSLANLPVLPHPFRRRPRKGQSTQLRLLKKLSKRGDISFADEDSASSAEKNILIILQLIVTTQEYQLA